MADCLGEKVFLLHNRNIRQSLSYILKRAHPEYLAFSPDSALDFRLIERSLDLKGNISDNERAVYEFLAKESISRIRCSKYSFLGIPNEHYFVYHAGKADELLLIQKENGVKTGTTVLKMSPDELDLACQLAEKVNEQQFTPS